MSSRRRLVSGSSRAAGRQSEAVNDDSENPLDLPPYQPPRYPLNAAGQRALRDLNNKTLDSHVKTQADESVKALSETVFALNERLTTRRKAVATMKEREAKRRRANNGEADETLMAQIKEAEATVRELEDTVEPLTVQLEAALREVLDLKAAQQDEKEIMSHLLQSLMARQAEITEEARGSRASSEADEPNEGPGVPVYDVIRQEFKAKVASYNALSAFDKYAKQNDYIDFKRSWHEGLFPNEEVPVPNARTWFDADGQPRHVTGREAGRDGGDDSDEEIQIAREKRSYRCPLSLVQMTEPYTCRRCKHSFQKEAIFDYLKIKSVNSRGASKQCPEAGCGVMDMNREDLYLDEALLRRMKRDAEQGKEASSDDEEEHREVVDDSMEIDED